MRHTQICVLGVNHLPPDVPEGALTTARQRLLAWAPDAVAIEVIPGEQALCQSQVDPDWAEQGLLSIRAPRDCAVAVADLHPWTLPEARARALDPTTEPHDRVIAWMAAYEPFTALLHAEGVDLPHPARQALDTVARDGREVWRIAGWVAARLGHQRLWPIDDLSDYELTDAQWQRIQTAFWSSAAPLVEELHAEETAALAAGDLWPYWLRLNTPGMIDRHERLESGTFVATVSDDDAAVGRLRLAQWRSRNLHMAAYLRAVAGQHPGGRVLAVVGASHAGPLRAALSTDQHDIELVDLSELDRLS